MNAVRKHDTVGRAALCTRIPLKCCPHTAQRVAATYWLLTSGRPSIACTCGMTHATKLDRSAGGRAGSGDAGDFTPTTLTHQPARTWRTSLCLSALAVSSSPRPTYPSALPNRAFGVVGGGGGGAASAHRVSRDDVPSVATASSSTSDDDTRHHHHHRPVLTRPRRNPDWLLKTTACPKVLIKHPS